MDLNLKKKLLRLGWISGNAIFQFLGLAWTFVLAFFVFRYKSQSLWGEMVNYLIVVNFIAIIVNWGQNGFLNRAFSQQAGKLSAAWKTTTYTRCLLLILCAVALLLFYPTAISFWLILWILMSYLSRSFDALHLYERKFKRLISIEVFALMSLILLCLIFRQSLTLHILIKAYVVLNLWRSLNYIFLYKKYIFNSIKWKFDLHFLKQAFPFFIPAFVGFLQTRIDLYAVAYYLTDDELGVYQIFFKLIALFFMLSRIVIGPFYKNIYRLNYKALNRLNWTMTKLGVFMAIPLSLLIYILLPLCFNINLDTIFFILAILIIIPFYAYIILANLLVRYNREYEVVIVYTVGIVFSILFNCLLVPYYGIKGALIATVFVQWSFLLIFKLLCRKDRISLD